MTITDRAHDIDEEVAGGFAEQLLGAALGTVELNTMYIGRTLGLYAALRGAPATSSELASVAGIDHRYAQEWLEQQAVAGTLVVEDASAQADERRFTLPEEHAVVLLDEEHPAYSGALADMVGPVARTVELVVDAFRHGGGVP